jgi:lysophospholipase L1-like esterase
MNYNDTTNTKKKARRGRAFLVLFLRAFVHSWLSSKSPRPQRLCAKPLPALLFVSFYAFSWQFSFVAVAKEPAAKKGAGPARFEAQIAEFESYDRKNAAPAKPILFVGSSTIRLWETHEAFPDLPIINRGFGGSTIADVNHFADRIVFKYKPRLIVFYAGDNDLAAGRTPDRVFSDFKSFVKSVRGRLPGTPIIFLSIKPSPKRWTLRPLAKDVNARIEDLTGDDALLTYVETEPTILGDDGQPRKDVFRDDGLHLNDKGYAAWNRLLENVLDRPRDENGSN